MSLTLKDIEDAYHRIHPYLKPTPLLRSESLEKKLNFTGKIFFKMESEQPTGSFKVRGAFNNLLQFSNEEKSKGVITRSSGNFAQAVSFAAQKLHLKALIVMPENAPKTKIEGTKKYGAEIQFSGPKHEEGDAAVEQLIKTKGLIPIHPYNDYRTMAGQGTAAVEILEECPEIDYFFCPVGGGGLMSGCSTAFKETRKSIYTYAVEPSGAGDYQASRQSGKKETWENINTIADGLRASSVGELNYPILNRYVDVALIVSEAEIKSAMKEIHKCLNTVSEPSGAVALAGFLKCHQLLKGNIVILLSGKNVDSDCFAQWMTEVDQ